MRDKKTFFKFLHPKSRRKAAASDDTEGEASTSKNTEIAACAPAAEEFVVDAADGDNIVVPEIRFLFHVPSPAVCN